MVYCHPSILILLFIACLLGNPAIAEQPKTLLGHTDHVTCVAFSPDNKTLISTGADRTVRVWDPAAGKLVATLRDADPNGGAAVFSPDGKYFAATCGGLYSSAHAQVVVWDSATRKPLYSMPLAYIQEPAAVAFSPDGARLATGAGYPSGGWSIGVEPKIRQSGAVEVWDRDDFKKFPFPQKMENSLTGFPKSLFRQRGALSAHEEPVTSLAFTRDGTKLFTGGGMHPAKGVITFWRIDNGSASRQIKLESPAVRIALSPDGRLLASSTWKYFNLFGRYITDPKLLEELRSPTDQIVQLWNVETGKPAGDLAGHTANVTSVAFSPNGKYLASGGMDKTVRLWRVDTRENVATLAESKAAILCLAFSPDGSQLAAGCTDKNIHVWSLEPVLKPLKDR
jgi:WD40 repeat protein